MGRRGGRAVSAPGPCGGRGRAHQREPVADRQPRADRRPGVRPAAVAGRGPAAAAPSVHGAQRPQQHPRRRLPDRQRGSARAAGAGHAPRVHLLPQGVRLGHVRLPRADRDHLRGPGPPAAQAAGPGHAGRAGLDGPAAAPDRAGRRVQRLQRRRLLLPGRPRPGGDPHQPAPSAGRGPAGRRLRRAARLRPERARGRRTTSSSRPCPTGRGASGWCPRAARS